MRGECGLLLAPGALLGSLGEPTLGSKLPVWILYVKWVPNLSAQCRPAIPRRTKGPLHVHALPVGRTEGPLHGQDCLPDVRRDFWTVRATLADGTHPPFILARAQTPKLARARARICPLFWLGRRLPKPTKSERAIVCWTRISS